MFDSDPCLILVILNISITAPTCLISIEISLLSFIGLGKDYVVVFSCHRLVFMLIYVNFCFELPLPCDVLI